MPTISDLELFKAAYKTVKEIIRVKEGENLLITIDSISDFREGDGGLAFHTKRVWKSN